MTEWWQYKNPQKNRYALHTCFKAKLINDCLNVFGNLIALAVSEEQVFELLTCNSTLNKVLIKVRKNIKKISVSNLFNFVKNFSISLFRNCSFFRVTAAPLFNE